MRLAKVVRPLRRIAVLTMLLLVACVGNPEGLDVAAHHAPAITTTQPSYLPNQDITVSWTEMPGNQMDWVSINVAGSPPTSGFVRYAFINGQVAGSQTFAGLPVGSYEARAYVDNTYTIIASSTFTVAESTAVTITTDQATYQTNPTVVVSWTNMPGNNLDWISINVAGSGPSSGFVQWTYIGGQTSGSHAFSGGIPAGNYEARAYLDNTYTVLASSTFSVVDTAVTTDKSVYAAGESVVVSFTGMPGNQNDYIAITTAGSPPNSGFVQSQYTLGEVNGQRTFANLPAGQYEARAYLDNTYTILASTSFTVNSANTTITTDKASYTAGETVIATWAGLPGNATDWIAISTAGSPDNSAAVQWVYTAGMASGSYPFTNLPAGNYEARAYLNNTFTVAARSPVFVIGTSSTCVSAPQRPVFASLSTGELVIDAMAQEASVPLTVPLDRSILFMSMRANEPSPRHGGVICQLHDAIVNGPAAGITCSKNNVGTDFASSNGTITVRWSVATFTSGVTVQRGLASTSTANPSTVTLASVNPAESFVVLGGMYNGGTGWGNNEFVRASLVNATTLDIRTNSIGTDVPWQVVSMIGANVQRGTASLASGDTVATVAIPTAPSGTVPLASYTTDNASGIAAAALMLQTSLSDANTLEFRRSAGGSALDVSWEVVSLPFATISGTASFAAGVASQSSPISGHSAAASVAITSSQAINGQSSGSTTYAGADLDIVGEAQATLAVTSNSVSLQRAASQASAEIPWSVIDFSRDCTGL